MRIDWESIRNDYINGTEIDGKRAYPSQPDLAEKYKIDKSQIGRMASKEGWLERRQIVVSKISEKSQKKTIEQVSNKGVDFDLKCFKQAQSIRELLEKKITEDLKPQDLATLVRALKDNQAYAKEALGEGIVQEDQKITIEIVK